MMVYLRLIFNIIWNKKGDLSGQVKEAKQTGLLIKETKAKIK